MKKIFTLSMMAAAVLSMSATELKQQKAIQLPKLLPTENISSKFTFDMPVAKKHGVRKAAALKAPMTEEDVIGLWTLTAASMTSDGNDEFEVEILPSENVGKIILKNFLGTEPEGFFDADNGELHIPYQIVGTGEYNEYVRIANTYITSNNGTTVVTIDEADIILYLEGDKFVFDNPIGLWGEEVSPESTYGAWSKGEMTSGWNWENIGDATYNDFVLHYIVSNLPDNAPTSTKVQAQRNLTDRGVYRLVAPFEPYVGYDNNMEIWIDDPACVIFPLQFLLPFGNKGDCYWGSASSAVGVGMPEEEGGMTIEQFLSSDFAEANISFDVEKATIEIGAVPSDPQLAQFVFTFPAEWTANDQPVYLMRNDNKTPSVPTGSIVFDKAALASINATDPNAPVEYFNLMGQRVLNPAEGQLVIRRQGTQATKIIF